MQLARLVGCRARGDPDLDRFDAPEWDSSELGPQEGDKEKGAAGAAAAPGVGGNEGRKAAEGPAAATQAAGASPTLETDSPAGTSQHPGEAPPPRWARGARVLFLFPSRQDSSLPRMSASLHPTQAAAQTSLLPTPQLLCCLPVHASIAPRPIPPTAPFRPPAQRGAPEAGG